MSQTKPLPPPFLPSSSRVDRLARLQLVPPGAIPFQLFAVSLRREGGGGGSAHSFDICPCDKHWTVRFGGGGAFGQGNGHLSRFIFYFVIMSHGTKLACSGRTWKGSFIWDLPHTTRTQCCPSGCVDTGRCTRCRCPPSGWFVTL